MGFHALFERENVLEILQQTIQAYYTQRFPGQNISVGYEKKAGAAEFYLIPRLGMIMQKKPGREIRKHYYDAFNIRKNPIKWIAAKVLVFSALHFPKQLAMPKRLYVWPKEAVNAKTLYSYCNRSIRIFDYKKGTTVSIQKYGFTDKFFQNQLQFRLHNTYQFIPELLDSGKDWFEECIYTGKVLARVTDAQQYAQAQQQTLDDIRLLQTDTLEMVSTQGYVSELCCRIQSMLERTEQRKKATYSGHARGYVQRLERFLQGAPEQLPVVISHKDLQGGNVLATRERLWIIDWETQGKGSRWFDAITMLYGTRYYGGIRKLLQDVLSDDLPEQLGQKDGWTAKQILALFLLEDLEFYLEDMLELSGTAGSATFDRYMAEIWEEDWTAVF